MIKTAFAAFKLAGIATHLVTAGVIVAALLAGYAVWHHKVYQGGVDDTVAKIARGDAKIVARANEARRAVRTCKAAGKQWDQTTGGCR